MASRLQAQALSLPQKRELTRMRRKGEYEFSVVPITVARALQRRGLVEVKRQSIVGAVCVLTDEGRSILEWL